MKTQRTLFTLLITALPWLGRADSTTVSVSAGYSTIANNYNHGGNTLQEVLPLVAFGTVLYKWDFTTQSYTRHDYDDLALVWVPSTTLNPGEGAFIYSPVTQNITFTGTVPPSPPSQSRPAAAGKRFISDRWPFISDFQAITGYPPSHGDRMIFYNGVLPSLPTPPASASSVHLFSNGSWTPSLPLLAPWKSAFVDVVPLSLTLSCPANKTVECGSSWAFDPALATSGACTNVTLISIDTTNLDACTSTYRRAWFATDCQNGFATCTQVVTVVDTTPPVLTCAGDKTVQCGSLWTFDSPTAFDGCCATNPTVYLIDTTITNISACLSIQKRAWLAQDCCLNTSFCTQTVSVVDFVPPILSVVASKIVECGSAWTFDRPAAFDSCCSTNLTFQLVSSNAIPLSACQTIYTGIIRVTDCCGNYSQATQLVTTVDTVPPGIVCASNKTVECTSLWSFDPPIGNDFCCGNTDLTKVLVNTNIVQTTPCQTTWAGTWRVGDCCNNFTTCTQYVTVVNSLAPTPFCPPNKTVTAGTLWTFDLPVLTNTCCGTNVSLVDLGTTTNGWCPKYLTKHWQLMDCCANVLECYQVVTLVSNCTECLTIACPHDIRLPCASLTATPVTWTISATNNCNPTDLVTWSVPPPGFPFTVGITPVTAYASNSLGEVQTCTFSVTIFVPAPRLGGLRIPGPLGVPLLALAWARSCHDFGVEAAPILGDGSSAEAGPLWAPLGGIPTGEWSQPNPTNNALDLFVDADIPMPDPANTNILPQALLRLTDHPGSGVNFSGLATGVYTNGPNTVHGFAFSKPGGGDPEIIDLNNQHVLRIGPEGLEINCPTNFPVWPDVLSKLRPPPYHEIHLAMARLPGSKSMTVTAYDTQNQLVGALVISNLVQTVDISSLGHPIRNIIFPPSPGGGGGMVSIGGGGLVNPLLCNGPDYRSASIGPVPNPWIQPGLTLTSRLTTGDLDPNTRIEDGVGGHGYYVEYSTEVAFAPCCRFVRVLLVQDSGTGEVVVRNAAGAVLGTYLARVHEPLTINLGPFSAPSCTVTITCTTGHARILRLCCSSVAQASCLPTFQVGSYSNPYPLGFASLLVNGGSGGPSATTVLNHGGKVVLDLGSETVAELNAPCDRAALQVISDGVGGMTLEALNDSDTVVASFGPLASSSSLQHVVLAAPGIKRIRIRSPNLGGYLYSWCCVPD